MRLPGWLRSGWRAHSAAQGYGWFRAGYIWALHDIERTGRVVVELDEREVSSLRWAVPIIRGVEAGYPEHDPHGDFREEGKR